MSTTRGREDMFNRKPVTQCFTALFDAWEAHAMSHYAKLPVIFDRAKGVRLLDVDGNEYFDATSAYSCLNLGHTHPAVLSICKYFGSVDQNGWGPVKGVPNRTGTVPMITTLEEITDLMGYDRFIYMNSGAEAVETALKLAAKHGHTVRGIPLREGRVIVAQNNFHGRTARVIELSGTEKYKKYFGPYADMAVIIPYNDVPALRAALEMYKGKTLAFLVEPIQGEGGVIIPAENFISDSYALCEEYKVPMIADEIQSGLGRAGELLSVWHNGCDVRPHMVLLGKSLGGGLTAVSGVLAKQEYAVFDPGDHGSTYAGNPFGASIAGAVLNTIAEEHLCTRSKAMGQYLKELLTESLSHYPFVKEIRGRGLMLAIAFHDSVDIEDISLRMLRSGVLSITAHDAARVTPPLIISSDECDELVERIDHAFRSIK